MSPCKHGYNIACPYCMSDKSPAVMKTCKTCGRTPPMCYCSKEPADAECTCVNPAVCPDCKPYRELADAETFEEEEQCPICLSIGMNCECARTLRLPKHLRGGAGNSPRKPLRGTSSRKMHIAISEVRSDGSVFKRLLGRYFVLEAETPEELDKKIERFKNWANYLIDDYTGGDSDE